MFQTVRNKQDQAHNISLTLMYTEHSNSRWCTPDFHSASTTISAFVPPWHQDLWPRVQVIHVNCLQPGGDSLLHVGDCCKPLASQVHIQVSKDMETTGNHTCAWLLCYSWRLRPRSEWLRIRPYFYTDVYVRSRTRKQNCVN